MGENELGVLIGILIASVGGILIGALIGAILLRAGASWVAKLDIRFGSAFLTVLIANVINFALGFIVALITAVLTGFDEDATMQQWGISDIVLIMAGVLVHAGVIAIRHKLSIGKSLLITLVMIGLALAITIGVLFLFLIPVALLT